MIDEIERRDNKVRWGERREERQAKDTLNDSVPHFKSSTQNRVIYKH